MPLKSGLTVVLDVGKTLTKLSLWGPSGEMIARESRPNQRPLAAGYACLDADGIEAWACGVLRNFASLGRVTALVPVAHGAAIAVLRDGKLACPPVDYEATPPAEVIATYEAARDSFGATGSPRLPDGLNAGVQLEWLEVLHPGLLSEGATLVTWPQYWAWRFCGIAATEVTSLGCHSDLWRPLSGTPSALATARGWSRLLAPLRRAGEVLGTLTAEWSERTGLSSDVQVYCGLHDSNAALLAARGFREIAAYESTVLSTGTWFVAMRSPAPDSEVDISALSEARDCLVNVDAYGVPVPSARFMGGREIEVLSGIDARRIDIRPDQPKLVATTADVVRDGVMVLPTFARGFGPFPDAEGRWVNMPADAYACRAAVCLYAALVADASLNLIGARERIVVEGRFAEAEVFVRALAALRPGTQVYVSNARHDVSYGALRLIEPRLQALSPLEPVRPLDVDLTAYAGAWRGRCQTGEAAA